MREGLYSQLGEELGRRRACVGCRRCQADGSALGRSSSLDVLVAQEVKKAAAEAGAEKVQSERAPELGEGDKAH
jgi:hypothetical protein